MYTIKQILFSIFIIFFSGCSFLFLASPIITGIVMWKQGEAKKHYIEDYQIVCRATKRTLKDMKIDIIRSNSYNYETVILAGNGNRFKIKIYKNQDSYTSVSMRINAFGDKQLAELIYSNIDNNMNVIEYDTNGKPVD